MTASTSRPRPTTPLRATAPPASALVVTADPLLLEELGRLAAAAGTTPEHVSDVGAALPVWSRAALVLVGADVLPQLALVAPGRRPGVHVVAWGPPGEELYRPALRLGAEAVLGLPDGAGVLTELLTDLGDDVAGSGTIIGVVAGSGGAGATTFAAALAQMGAELGPTVLIDADPLGPGVDSVLGMEDARGVHWGELAATTGRLGARALREALPRAGTLGLLTWERSDTRAGLAPSVAREVLSAAERGHRLVVVDLPRTLDPVSTELAARCDLQLLVVRASVAGVSAAARLIGRMPTSERLRLVVRGGGGDPEAVAASLGVPLLTAMNDQRHLAESIDLGLGPVRSRRGALGRAARDVLARCSLRAEAA